MNYYYHPSPKQNDVLSNEESSHAIKALRKKEGDTIHIMDGLGGRYEAIITNANHRKCEFEVIKTSNIKPKEFSVHIAIAPTKNIDRIEWFVEKVCELGANSISFIESKRTERSRIKLERIEKKAISAMKQSKNFWKCKTNELVSIDTFIKASSTLDCDKFIAFVETGEENALHRLIKPDQDVLVMIGPEGDFTQEEVDRAKSFGFTPVNLGKNVLRTETAGIVAAHTINLVNDL